MHTVLNCAASRHSDLSVSAVVCAQCIAIILDQAFPHQMELITAAFENIEQNAGVHVLLPAMAAAGSNICKKLTGRVLNQAAAGA